MQTPTRRRAAAIPAFALFAGCAKDSSVDPPAAIPDQTNGRTTVINDEARLAARMTVTSDDVAFDGDFLVVAAGPGEVKIVAVSC